MKRVGVKPFHKDCVPYNKVCDLCELEITKQNIFDDEGFSTTKSEPKKYLHKRCGRATIPSKSNFINSTKTLKKLPNFITGERSYSFHFDEYFWHDRKAKEIMMVILKDLWDMVQVRGYYSSLEKVVEVGIKQIHKGESVPTRIIVYSFELHPLVEKVPFETIIILV